MGSRGIRVNAIVLGPTQADSFASAVSSEGQEQLKQMAPLQRLAEPEDIANAVAFLSATMPPISRGTLFMQQVDWLK